MDENLIDCWVVRHGQSRAQLGLEDSLDPDLSERGVAQAMRLRDLLQRVAFDRVLISPLRRTIRTYELSAIRHPRAAFDSRLLEYSDANERYAGLLPLPHHPEIAADRHRSWNLPFEERIEAMIDALLDMRGERILLVAHHGTLGALLRVALTGCHLPDFGGHHVDNCALGRIRFHPDKRRGSVIWWNHVAHIRDLLDDDLYDFEIDGIEEAIEEPG